MTTTETTEARECRERRELRSMLQLVGNKYLLGVSDEMLAQLVTTKDAHAKLETETQEVHTLLALLLSKLGKLSPELEARLRAVTSTVKPCDPKCFDFVLAGEALRMHVPACPNDEE